MGVIIMARFKQFFDARVSSAAAILIIAAAAFAFGLPESAAEVAVTVDKDLVIPISGVSEIATFYPVEVEGTRLEVIAVTASDGTIRTAFNTCQVCYDSGRGYYKQQGSVLVCQNCGNRFKMDQVEISKGGCNPVPIFKGNKTADDKNITIPYSFLQEAKVIFGNWKREY
jgi:uncharacterized membrane protein